MIPIPLILEIGSKILDKVIPNPEAKAQAQLKLLEMQHQGELQKMQADITEQEELTKRLQADMGSDSWLSNDAYSHLSGLLYLCLYVCLWL
jgi:hypothetical protein